MPWIRLLLLTALLASPALPGHANEGPRACGEEVMGADSDADALHCLRTDLRASGPAQPPVEELSLDCSPFALGGLASGAAASGVQASALLNATIRHCSLRGYLFGVAMVEPLSTDAGAVR